MSGNPESVRINVVFVLSRLNLEKVEGLSFPRDKANFPEKRGFRRAGFDCGKNHIQVVFSVSVIDCYYFSAEFNHRFWRLQALNLLYM